MNARVAFTGGLGFGAGRHFYRHFAPLGLPVGASELLFLRIACMRGLPVGASEFLFLRIACMRGTMRKIREPNVQTDGLLCYNCPNFSYLLKLNSPGEKVRVIYSKPEN